jgi:hypothetical protein
LIAEFAVFKKIKNGPRIKCICKNEFVHVILVDSGAGIVVINKVVGQKTKKLLIPGIAKRFFSSAQTTYQLRNSPNSTSTGYWGLFPLRQRG